MQKQEFSTELSGKTLTASFTDLAEQTSGSVLLRYGETAILVTAVMGDINDNAAYFPLSVEFEEKFYAAGQILGSRFQRREGRPSDEAVLSARIVDRTLRPLFHKHLRAEVQIVITVLAIGEDDPDVLGIIGASLALAVSDIPWNGPVGAVRIGRNNKNKEIIINPTYQERRVGELDFEILSCGKDEKINMIETSASEISESDIVSVLEASTEVHKKLEAWQQEIVTRIGKKKKEIPPRDIPNDVIEIFNNEYKKRLEDTIFSKRAGKNHIHELKTFFLDNVRDIENVKLTQASDYFEEQIDELLHEGVITKLERADGRGMDDVRPLFAQAGGVSPVLHGSGIFYRGGTHIFTALTLGGPGAAQQLDTVEERDTKKRFMHHYNFPPFSVGESGRVGGFNRRMIGHGSLAEKALLPLIPNTETFPYTIRLVSETLSSNGSSSMGSVCASTLALMDGGVPLLRPVAGIASGLMLSENSYVLLTDIQGPEDEHGDMDFKVAGTRRGVTAIQMDVKVDGIPVAILKEALEKAKAAREKIIDVIEKEISQPREKVSDRAPEIISLKIQPDQIGLVIGGGGKTINKIKEDAAVEEISIEEDGTVFITGKNGSAKLAQQKIESLTRVYKVGEKLKVKITRIAPFGAFASLDEHNEGLIHISEIAPWRLENLDGILKEGEEIEVTVTKVEEGKIGLSIKQADKEFAEKRGLQKPST